MHKFVYLAIILLPLVSCKNFPGNDDPEIEKSKIVVKVGNLDITEDMITMRAQMVEDVPTIKDPEIVATAQLVQGTLASIVAARYGRPVSEASVQSFWKAYKNSIPKKLAAIEAKTRNKSFFLIVMVMPDFASMAVQDIYYSTDEPHSDEIDQTQQVLTKVINHPGQFERIAMEERLSFDQVWISSNDIRSESEQRIKSGKVATDPSKVITDARELPPGQQAPANEGPPGYSDAERDAAAELYKQLGSTPTGQVHPRPIQTPDAFQLVKVEKREKGRAKISLITIEKLDYEEWFWKSASNIAVEFPDVKMGERFLSEVPWGQKLLVREDLYPTIFPKRPPRNINRQNQFPYPPLP